MTLSLLTSKTPLIRPAGRARPLRLLAAPAAAAALALATASSASAHVHVIPDGTSSGAYVALTFRVPTESATASTIKLVATLPRTAPIASVATKPVPGWTATVTAAPLPTRVKVDGTTLTRAPRTVTWTASNGHGIKPGQYQEFSISAGPLPAPGQLVIPVAQYYSDGTVVRWDQPSTKGKPEPEHPAPAFTVTASNGTDDPAPVAAPATAATATPATRHAHPDAVARWLAGAALAFALAGLGAVAALWRRRPRSAAPVTEPVAAAGSAPATGAGSRA